MGRWMFAALPVLAAAATHAAIPVEHFAREPSMRNVALSPEGKRFVYISGDHKKPVIVLYDLEKREPQGLMAGEVDNMTVGYCAFKTEDRVLCSYRGTVRDFGQTYDVSRLVAINSDGTGMKVLVQNNVGNGTQLPQFQDRVMHWLPEDPEHVLVQLDDNGDVYPSVFMLNVMNGRMRTVLGDRSPITRWSADRRGVVRFGYGYRENNEALYMARDGADAPWRTLVKFKRFEQDFSLLGFGAGDSVLISALHNGRRAVWEVDLADRAERQLVFSHPEADVSDTIEWGRAGRIAGFEFETDRPQAHYIDPEVEAIRKALDTRLPDTLNAVTGVSRDDQKLLVYSYSDTKPGAYRLFDLSRKVVTQLGERYPELASAPLAPMKSISVPGPGGLRIPGYLTLPPQGAAGKLPAIVYPHGGPYSRDSWGFDPVVQFLASRGYAVLQLNFRGSTGYGSEWYEAGWQGWGTVMHDDITAGARWLLAEGIADEKRMCIVGWSYGGFAALLGAVKEPALYRCAVSIAGVSDIIDLQADWRFYYGGRAAMRELAGTDTEELKAISPKRNAAQIKVPVLLVHGTHDARVDVDHSRDMAKALARAKVPHELLIIEDGDHSLTRSPWRLALYRKLEAFLAAHLSLKPEA
jgi:dipeptidyl aminopeptidase/acylaminoacyl peptidase